LACMWTKDGFFCWQKHLLGMCFLSTKRNTLMEDLDFWWF
jgi:hypothetical protein